jgi:hypothetical protein
MLSLNKTMKVIAGKQVNQTVTSAGGVVGAQPASQRAGGSANLTPALQPSSIFGPKDLEVRPIPNLVARQLCTRHHYLGSYPGGAILNFGIFAANSLLGVVVLGVGPANVHRLFAGAEISEVVCLARLWLDDRLGRNCESHTLAIILRHLRKDQATIKALVAYSDPEVGHTGCIYRAAGFLYIGRSEPMPLYQLPDGKLHHSRSLSHAFGTHSRKHFKAHGVPLKVIPQTAKLIYVALVDPAWRQRLTRPVLPYLRQGEVYESD